MSSPTSPPRPVPPPLGDPEEFAAIVAEFTRESAPARFAIVQELPVRADARVIGWGLDFGDRAVVHSAQSESLMPMGVFQSASRAAALMGAGRRVHLVWIDDSSAIDETRSLEGKA